MRGRWGESVGRERREKEELILIFEEILMLILDEFEIYEQMHAVHQVQRSLLMSF